MSLQSDLPGLPGPDYRGDGVDWALDLFRRAAKSVPGYARHLRDHGVAPGGILTVEDFADVPTVTKDNYIRRHPLPDRVWNGDLTQVGTFSTSSGSSGEPTYWPRAERAQAESVDLHDRIFRRCFRSHIRSTLVVNAFAMGNWIGGTYTYAAALELKRRGHRLSVIAPGIDVATILDNIEMIGPGYEQVVLAGYPPFVKGVLDAAGPEVLDQDLRLLLAGETITEAWRDYALNRLGHPGEPDRICLVYGTADMGMIGHETPTTIAVRRAARDDGALHRALFGGADAAPTFVEYDPTIRYAETDPVGRLLFTSDGVAPLIRYRINDEGALWTAEDLDEVLRDHGHAIPVRRAGWGGGFIALAGRTDIAAILYGLNVYPENVKHAIEADPVRLSGKFAVTVDTTDLFEQALVLHAELVSGVGATSDLREDLIRRAVAELERTNSEYRELRRTKGDLVSPRVVLHEFGHTEGPKSRLVVRP